MTSLKKDELHSRGLLCAEQGEFQEAQSCLEQALALDPEDVTLYLQLANILKAQGLMQAAIELLQKAIQRYPQFPAFYNNLGTFYYNLKQWPEAIDAYQQAIDLQANYLDAYYNLGLALAKTSNLNRAITTFQALLELSDRHEGAQFQLGCLWMRQEKYAKACQAFSAIEREYPFHFETQVNLATCYMKLGDLEAARTHYLYAASLQPDDVQTQFNLGVINTYQGNLADAIKCYQHIIELNPDHHDAQYNLGIIYFTQKQTSDALNHLQKALRLRPDPAVAHLIDIMMQKKQLAASPLEYIKTLFDSYAEHYDAHIQRSLNYQVPGLCYQAIANLPLPAAKIDILDLGCGTGLCGELFKPLAKHLVGVDISSKMLTLAKHKHLYDELIETDIFAYLDQSSATFDLIIAGDVLIYSGDLTEFFKKSIKALKAGGYLVFNVETGAQHDYIMTSSGRFAHSQTYVDGLARVQGYQLVQHQQVILRTQNMQAVPGYLYVLQKQP